MLRWALSQLSQVSASVKALERAGWAVVRQRGSHVRMKHPDRRVSLPVPLHRELSAALSPASSATRPLSLRSCVGSSRSVLKACLTTDLGEPSRGNWKLAADHSCIERTPIFPQPFDIQLKRLVCIRGRLIERVALRMQARKVGCVDVVAALLLGGKYKLNLAGLNHALSG